LPVGGKVPLLDEIRSAPTAPQYWWAYALLLSTMIPSLVNLTIGGFCLVRGIPIISQYLYAHLPAGQAVVPDARYRIAFILMCQWIAGICLGVLAQVFLVWGIFIHLLPGLGFGVLDLARSVAIFNVPAHVLRLF
jgi:hypothetical protein